jgi:hypothetical protein
MRKYVQDSPERAKELEGTGIHLEVPWTENAQSVVNYVKACERTTGAVQALDV